MTPHFSTTRLATAASRLAPENGPEQFTLGLEGIESGTGKLSREPWVEPSVSGNLYCEGDLLYGKLRPYLKKAWVADRKGSFIGDFIRMRSRPGWDPHFLRYVILSPDFTGRATAESLGSKMPRTEWDRLREIRVPAPPHGIQQQIADYLDHETAEIDAFIADLDLAGELSQQRWIALRDHLLSLGPTPLAPEDRTSATWFGTQNKSWREGPLKRNFGITLGKMLDEKSHQIDAEVFPYIRAGNIKEDELDLSDTKNMPFSANERSKFSLRAGDILVVEGGSVGTNAALSHDIEDVYFQKTVNRMRPRDASSSIYYSEVLNAYRDREVFDVVGNRSTIMHLTAEKLANLEVPIPSIGEQHAIASLLTTAKATKRDLDREFVQAIDLAKERRAALITAAVTGQIDVTTKNRPAAEQLEEDIAQGVHRAENGE